MISVHVPIILASQSPRRSLLLQQVGIKFDVVPSSIHEKIDPKKSFAENVKSLSFHKASDIAHRFSVGIVIGADTIVVIENRVLGKPVSSEQAKEMLKLLSGKTHTVYTGFAFVDAATKKSYIDFESTDVTFRVLTDKEIENYVSSGSPMDKAGAYGIQDDFGAVFVEKISGDYYTVVGFPLCKFYIKFQKFLSDLGRVKGEQ
jgi:septum formation protein